MDADRVAVTGNFHAAQRVVLDPAAKLRIADERAQRVQIVADRDWLDAVLGPGELEGLHVGSLNFVERFFTDMPDESSETVC